MGKLNHYTKEIKTLILGEYSKTLNAKNLIKKYNIPKSTLYNWIKNNKRIKHTDITYAEYNKLKKLLEKRNFEFEIYEKLHCFKDSSTKEKEIAISKFVGIYPIKTMCRVLDIPKGTFYNYLLRKKTVTNFQIRDESLKQSIYKIFKESDERFGAKKILVKLRSEGIKTTLRKVQTLMKMLNLKSKQCLKKIETSKKDNSQYYVNKLQRIFNQNAPNKYWVSDVTEVKVKKNKFYLCVILDLFSRKVIAYRLACQNNLQLIINTFKDAYEKRNRPQNLFFHSDQGTNYTAFEFRDLLRSLKINQSFSKAGNPYDNACMESFFSSFKREEYNYKDYEFFDDLIESVKSYMKFYNEYRPHETLKNKTPNQFEEEYFNDLKNKKVM